MKMKAELGKVKGLDRAKLLDRLVEAYGKLDNEIDELSAWSKEIVSLDADNKAGLKTKYEFRVLMAGCDRLKEEQKLDEVKACVEKALALPGLTGPQKQDAYMVKGECCSAESDFRALWPPGQGPGRGPRCSSAGNHQLVENLGGSRPLAFSRSAFNLTMASWASARGLNRSINPLIVAALLPSGAASRALFRLAMMPGRSPSAEQHSALTK